MYLEGWVDEEAGELFEVGFVRLVLVYGHLIALVEGVRLAQGRLKLLAARPGPNQAHLDTHHTANYM